MREKIKKIVRYLAITLLVVGILFIIYGTLVNNIAISTFLQLLNQRGFWAFVLGVVMVIVAVALLITSVAAGVAKPTRAERKAQRKEERAAQRAAKAGGAPEALVAGEAAAAGPAAAGDAPAAPAEPTLLPESSGPSIELEATYEPPAEQ